MKAATSLLSAVCLLAGSAVFAQASPEVPRIESRNGRLRRARSGVPVRRWNAARVTPGRRGE